MLLPSHSEINSIILFSSLSIQETIQKDKNKKKIFIDFCTNIFNKITNETVLYTTSATCVLDRLSTKLF